MKFSVDDIKAIRHPSEETRFLLTLFVLLPMGLLIVSLTVMSVGVLLILVPIILFAVWFTCRLFSAWYLNNTVLVTQENFPEVHNVIVEAKEAFGFDGQVDAYIYQDGSFNMAIMPLLRRKVILLNSGLVSGVEKQSEMRFLIGRFVGALAAKHYRFMWLQVFLDSIEKLTIFNILLYPYERAIQYSGDQLGLCFIGGDANTATQVFKKIMVGSEISNKVKTEALIKQMEQSEGSIFVWITRAFSSFPHVIYRIENIQRFARDDYPMIVSHMKHRVITSSNEPIEVADPQTAFADL